MTLRCWLIKSFVGAVIVTTAFTAVAEPAGHVTGLGGIFVKSKDPKALARWYHEVLGLEVAPWGGAKLAYDAAGHPRSASWAAFPQSTGQMSPSSREFMIDFAVDDMDAIVARLAAHAVEIIRRDDQDAFGRFVWILDPDGTKIELWQPK